jgi:hypothetical protein
VKAPELVQTQPWPWAVGTRECTATVGKQTRFRRPDVSGYFTFTLVAALASGSLVLGDVVRTRVRFEDLLGFVTQHPMALILACCAGVLAFLLAIGDV